MYNKTVFWKALFGTTDIWSEFKIADITSFMADIIELRPHVTVAVYNDKLPIEQFKGRFITATTEMSKINVKFDIISIFPTSGTVFIAPTMTSKLIETHRKYHNELAEYNAFEIGNGFNLPEWDPHCA
jgi:hypothetical protein